MSDLSVSDVDPDDLEQMIKGIDQLDHDLFGKKKPSKNIISSQEPSPTKQETKSEPSVNKVTAKKVQFEESTGNNKEDIKESTNTKPVSKKISFDEDDDILGALEKPRGKSTASVMDDIFGSKDNKDSFMDDIFGGKTSSQKQPNETKEFVLDSKYKKSDDDALFGVTETTQSSRRRRGNPTLDTPAPPAVRETRPEKTVTVPTNDQSKSADNPFPWMSNNSESMRIKTNEISTVSAPQVKYEQTVQQYAPASVAASASSSSLTLASSSSVAQASGTLPWQAAGSSHIQDKKPSDFLDQEMETQLRMMNDRKMEYTTAMEKQRQQFSEQVEQLYQRQSQMSQVQAEQSQRMMANFQRQMEEEMMMKQKMMNNQLQMMTKLQADFPAALDGNILDIMKKGNKNKIEFDTEVESMMKDKIKDIQSIFKTKEDKLIENYEYVIKDLENKLDIEQGKYREASENHKEEKLKLKEDHKEDLSRVRLEGKAMLESMKSEYMNVIENMKSLRKIEVQAKMELNGATEKISNLAETISNRTQDLDDEKKSFNLDIENQLKMKSQKLEQKEKELQSLQESLLSRQEISEKEQRSLTSTIRSLESKLHQKELELESQRRQYEHDKEELDYQKKQFEEEKAAIIETFKKERSKVYHDRDHNLKEINQMRYDLTMQMKQVKKEKARYIIHKKLQFEPDENNSQQVENTDEVKELLKALDEERSKLKKSKEGLKHQEKKLGEERRKLSKQRKDVANAVDKLYEVERGISDKFDQLAELHHSAMNIKVQGVDAVDEFKHLQEGVADFLQDIEEGMLELLKQEQKIKSEVMTLHGERKKINNTRKSLLCTSCSKPFKKSISNKDLRNVEDLEQILVSRSKPPIAWMDLQGDQTSRMISNFRTLGGSRTSGDGASLEALDSHVSALRRDAEADKKHLKEELDYLKTLQNINVRTVAKYQ